MTVSKQIIEVLDALSDKFGIAIDWTSKEVLPQLKTVAEHYIQYELWTSVSYLVLGIIGIVAGIVIPIKIHKSDKFDDEELQVILFIFSLIIGFAIVIISIVDIPGQIDDIIKCLICPELQCYEYIKDLIPKK